MRVCVVGAGIIGITSAIAVKEAFPSAEVTVFGETFSPNTTGDGSAGLWGPYILTNTNPTKVLRWAETTHKWMESFWKSEIAPDVGASLLPAYRVTSETDDYSDPVWAPCVYGFTQLSSSQLDKLNARRKNKPKYRAGWHFVTYTFEPIKGLPWLMEKFKRLNGKIIKRKITDLKELRKEGFDIVINCAGLGCREINNDHTVNPVRGQVTRIRAPWQFETFIEEDDDGNYVIPNIDTVIMGGTHQEGDFNLTVNPADSKFIKEGCERLYPSLQKGKMINEWVGLRPARQEVRLEPEIIREPGKEDFMIVHNYGHGGSGITLCWGCALNVVEILRQLQKANKPSKL
ncbi:D-aspartate oxidase [Phymastichus coffea]|uniref:D-aspartate oxidase n=1 Tax=Phymastichus coffea TaxID=108790 RepID=UPI00273CF493|nr:D-aspartate oxidase [Phymastichus coffea]